MMSKTQGEEGRILEAIKKLVEADPERAYEVLNRLRSVVDDALGEYYGKGAKEAREKER